MEPTTEWEECQNQIIRRPCGIHMILDRLFLENMTCFMTKI